MFAYMNSVTQEPRVNGPGFFQKIRIDPGKRLHELKKHIFFSVKSETRFLEENVSEIYCETRKTIYEVYLTNEISKLVSLLGLLQRMLLENIAKGYPFSNLRIYVYMYTGSTIK